MQIRGTFGGKGLPQIDPRQFAIAKFKKEKEELEKYVAENRLDASQMMYKPREQVKGLLYEGFSKEGKGRASYLKERKLQIPEKKYEFPVTSSWNYGWKLDECFALKRPTHARSSMIRDNFFTRNGIPTMREPNVPPPHGMERSVTCANINMC
ncbi:unnamed protein product [Dimorphilus gyrociliatus]|nr:unnamed protein product [Dimorphilus gyrociliatus]